MTDTDALLSIAEVAAFLSVPEKTVRAWRHKGTGPRAFKVGRHVRYRMADVLAFLEECADEPRQSTRALG